MMKAHVNPPFIIEARRPKVVSITRALVTSKTYDRGYCYKGLVLEAVVPLSTNKYVGLVSHVLANYRLIPVTNEEVTMLLLSYA